ncbi:phage terminase large subunit [Thermomonas carbonis]|uniref:Phage terminase large subunit n=1 Tax=Thermomonas carbonis TaxID=1463158 RepID=A0A7G9SLP7_9GAMM|nr:phage terminase large subunit [Thermomonas carbonis]QNN68772.1 phage terminase large subunit [Thermomonas carbonis]GHC08891.1 hypothetical protein GCM10010080_24940 [Thermomonas carbonis]
MTISVEQYNALLRQDLGLFIRRTFAHLDPQTTYAHNWHIDLLADRLMQVADGKIKRLIINVPPRSLKSIMASIAFPAWLLGREPTKRVICASYGQDLATKLGRDCHAVISSDWYKTAFPTRLMTSRSPIADFETLQRGGRLATSVGGVLTGRGGEVLIIDDPVKPDEAMSDSQRKVANEWFDNTLYSRLNNKTTGAIIIIMQRLHLDDLVGHVLEKEGWEVVSLPAIAIEDETWKYQVLTKPRVYVRAAGEALHPNHETPEALAALRSTLGEYAFSAQYQQSPVPMGGGFIKEAWLQRYTDKTKPKSFEYIMQSWDTANKASEVADYSVCTTWGIKDKKMYLLEVIRERLEYPELKKLVLLNRDKWDARHVLIEDKASGVQLIQELQRTSYKIIGIKCAGEKAMRVLEQTPAIEAGKVLFPEAAPWLNGFLNEVLTFPFGKYDDQVDSMAQAIKWIETHIEYATRIDVRWP